MSDDDMIRRGDALNRATQWRRGMRGEETIEDALCSVPAVQVGVKPMEWLEIRHGQYFEARVIGILYSVRLGTDAIARWQAGHMGTWRDAPSIEAAKAAAQADYDARIRSALTAQPLPDVAALVDALEFYADRDNYEPVYERMPCDCCTEIYEPVKRDEGDTARAALARVKGGDA